MSDTQSKIPAGASEDAIGRQRRPARSGNDGKIPPIDLGIQKGYGKATVVVLRSFNL